MNACYTHAAVLQRLVDFLGGDSLDRATAIYLTQPALRSDRQMPRALSQLLDQGTDLARSLADSESLLLHIDVAYVNFDVPAHGLLHPWRAFDLLAPVANTLETILLHWGIRPLHVLLATGHRFIWRVDRQSAVANRLRALAPAQIAPMTPMPGKPAADRSDAEAESDLAAISLVMEFVAHKAKQEASASCLLPVELTAVDGGPGATGRREMVCIDIAGYGDRTPARTLRLPFTQYSEAWFTDLFPSMLHHGKFPTLLAIPLHEMDVATALKVRESADDVCALAQAAGTAIPNQMRGTERLLTEHLASRLRRFYQFYYSGGDELDSHCQSGAGCETLKHLPPCVRRSVDDAGNSLHKPAGIQLVIRCLLAEGWHPREVAQFIGAKFAEPVQAQERRSCGEDPAARADFYTRVFAGLSATGLDGVADLNCAATQTKGLCCSTPSFRCSLEPFQRALRNAPWR